MFCKNCGNRLEDGDRVCAVCGEAVEPGEMSEKAEPINEEVTPSGAEDIKTPLFDFKWNVQDFPNENTEKTEDIDFTWETPKDPPLVEKMRKAVDPEEIAATPTFSEGDGIEESVTDDWYEPFSMKKSIDDETLFKFNKRNEEFQELLDKEFEKYNSSKQSVIPDEATKKYNIDDFKDGLERFKEDEKEDVKLPEKAVSEPVAPDIQAPVNVLTPEDLGMKSEIEPEIEDVKAPEPAVEVIEDTEPEIIPEPVAPANTSVSDTGIFDTSFASPFGAVETQKEAPAVSKAESILEPAVQETEPKTSYTSPVQTQEPIVQEPIIQKIEEAIIEETPEVEPASTTPGFNFIDTTFASPFGNAEEYEDKTEAANKAAADTHAPGSKAIDEDEFLKELPVGDGKSFTGPQQVSIQGQPQMQQVGSLPDDESDVADSADTSAPEEPTIKDVIGPEIVNEPVVFPFEMEEEEKQDEPIKEDPPKEEPPKKEVKLPAKEEEKPYIPKPAVQPTVDVVEDDVKKETAKPETTETEKSEKDTQKDTHGSGLIKFLIAMIIIVALLLAGIMVMKMAPDSFIGTALNNLTGTILGGGSAESKDEFKNVVPNQDFDALIESQLSANKNIKKIVHSDKIGYDETVSYSIMGANNSKPIENDFWKTFEGKDLLFDELAVNTVIGFNSSWVGYLNKGSENVFNYVMPESEAETVLKKETLPTGSKSVVYNKLTIGEIRQNGNKFYVWTQENITIKNNNGTEKKSKIKQLYELETELDSLLITTYVTL